MTVPEQPSDPAVPTPPVPEATPEEAAAQQAAAEKAAAEAALNEQIRALAAKIAEQAILDFDPLTLRKGIVSSLQTASAPPTVTITISGDTTTEIPGVRYYEHYPPAVGDVVHMGKQGTDLVAIGKIAEQHSETEFTDIPLAAGFTHNGNSNGNLKIRRVWDHGVWKVQVQGGVTRSSGNTISAALDPKYRPVNATRRTVLAARDATGSNVVKVDFENSGTVTLVGMSTAPNTGGSHNHSVNIDDNEHTHSIPDSTHQHPSHNHSVSITDNGHTHQIRETVHTHSGSHPSPADSPHTHGDNGALSTAVTITGNTGSNDAGESTHSHGAGTHGTAVTIDGTTGTDTDHSHSVTEPVWISFNMVEYFL